jgi:hypothetical protein
VEVTSTIRKNFDNDFFKSTEETSALAMGIYALWKKDAVFDPKYGTKSPSGNHDPKPLFSGGPIGPKTKVAADKAAATLDGLPCNQSPEALFSGSQIN